MQSLAQVLAVPAMVVAVLAYLDSQRALSAKRPWVNIPEKDGLAVRGQLTVRDGNARILIEVRSKNGGDSAAAGTNLFYRTLVMGTPPKNVELIAAKLNGACDRGNQYNKAESGELILPGDEVSLGEYPFTTTATEIGPAWVVGCIGYKDGKNNLYATSFFYSIENGNLKRMNGISTGGY